MTLLDRDSFRGRAAAGLALVLASGCAKPRATRAEPSAKVSGSPSSSAKLGLTAELDQLVQLSKTTSSPEQKRAKLQAALEHFPREHNKDREELLVAVVARGANDPPEWTTITSNYQGRRAEIQVTKDALTILGVRFDVTAEGAQRIADQLHAVLPTPRILQLVWEQADVRLAPCTGAADAQMASTARMLEHSRCVDERIAGRKGLVANEGKHWVLTNRIAGKTNLAANYGWFIKGRRPIQSVGTRHDTAHTDYSQIVRLVKPIIKVDGREVDIRRVGRSPELWGLVSDEGPLLVWRASRPGTAPSPRDNPVLAAPKPAPGDPNSVRLTLKSPGPPVRLDQLPETTTGLRRNTFQRRLLASLRMREEDVPEEAYWSAGAAACGGRDLFFELMNDVGVDLDELGRSRVEVQQSLACGKKLTAQIRAGIGVYQIDYDYESAPSGLALLTLPDDSFRDELLYPQLSPTPSGVHRAYCNDDEGGPRSVCQDGARSRLILAVNGGYLAAYAREVPSLLERLTGAHPPPQKVTELATFFLEPTRADEVAVAEGGSCAFAMDFSYLELSPDETSRQRVLDAVNDNTALCGTESSGTFLNPTRRLVFVAKDEAAARALASALKRRATEAAGEAVDAPSKREGEADFEKARHRAGARAAREAKIVLEGRRLSATVTVTPNAAELRAMSKLFDARRDAAKRAAEAIRKLVAGTLPDAAELAVFGAEIPRGAPP